MSGPDGPEEREADRIESAWERDERDDALDDDDEYEVEEIEAMFDVLNGEVR